MAQGGNGCGVSAERVLRGALAGFAGGLAGALMMTLMQAVQEPALRRMPQTRPMRRMLAATRQMQGVQGEALENTLEATAGAPRSDAARQASQMAIHFAFGGAMGALYGALAEVSPDVTAGRGATFGAALWLGADEAALPALGLTGPPTQMRPLTHAMSLGGHVAYGMVVEEVRRRVVETMRDRRSERIDAAGRVRRDVPFGSPLHGFV